MSEVVGFIIGIVLFVVLIFLLFHKFIFSINFLIILLSLLGVAFLIFLVEKIYDKKNQRKRQKEFEETLNQYMKVRKKVHLPKKIETVILDTHNCFDSLIDGENLIYKEKNTLCFFPNYPTIDNYLLYDDVKKFEIEISKIKKLTIIGEVKKSKDLYGKLLHKNVNIDLFLQDERRTLLVYEDDGKEYELILDFYAYDKIKELIK